MTYKTTTFTVALVTAALVTLPVSATAQDSGVRKVDDYTCKEVMRENGPSRDSAIAFLHGFMMGKSGGSDFDLEKLTTQTDAFIDHCLDNPGDKAVDAMAKVKG